VRDDSYIDARMLNIKSSSKHGIIIGENVHGKLSKCEISNCEAIGIEIQGPRGLTVADSKFENCKYSGLNVHKNPAVHFVRCAFNKNGQLGADLSECDYDVVFDECQFNENTEAGVKADKCQALFNSCTAIGNENIGFSLTGSSTKLTQCKVKRNKCAGIVAFQGDTSIFENTVISKNLGFGAQIHQKGTNIVITGGKIVKHQHSVNLMLLNNAHIEAENVLFEKAEQYNVEVRDDAVADMGSCTFGSSTEGVSVAVHSGGVLNINGGEIHEAGKVGLLVGTKGNLNMEGTTVERNGIAGMLQSADSVASVNNSRFLENGEYGMQINGGDIKFTNCTINQHKSIGVVLSVKAKVEYSDNSFEGNRVKNIYLNPDS